MFAMYNQCNFIVLNHKYLEIYFILFFYKFNLIKFLENHILEDVNKCVLALQEGDADTLDRTAGAIRGRSARVCNVVAAEMDNYEPGIYTEGVLKAVAVLRDQGNIYTYSL